MCTQTPALRCAALRRELELSGSRRTVWRSLGNARALPPGLVCRPMPRLALSLADLSAAAVVPGTPFDFCGVVVKAGPVCSGAQPRAQGLH